MKLYEPEHPRLDRLVFGVTAALAVGFVIWGFVSTASLGAVSSSAEGWVIENTGWLFVLAASFFVVFVIWLAASKYGASSSARTRRSPSSARCPGSP